MQLVDLSDEYHLTTANALDLCFAAGIAADSSATELTDEQVARFRSLAEQQRSFAEKQRSMHAASIAASEAAAAREAEAFSDAEFGPIPPAPWEAGDANAVGGDATPNDQPSTPADLAAAWQAVATPPVNPVVSLMATTALALGVISLVFPFATAIVAIGLAVAAKDRIRSSSGALTGERLATLALAISALGIAMWCLLLGVTMFRDWQQRNQPPFSDPQVDVGEISWANVKAGDCVRIPRVDVAVKSWQGVSCDGPHEGEVFFTMKLDNSFGSAFPGKPAIEPAVGTECKKQFEKYVGIDPRRSTLKIGVFYPTPLNWFDENDRNVGCIAYLNGYYLINGSLNDSRR
jgi:Septum formation